MSINSAREAGLAFRLHALVGGGRGALNLTIGIAAVGAHTGELALGQQLFELRLAGQTLYFGAAETAQVPQGLLLVQQHLPNAHPMRHVHPTTTKTMVTDAAAVSSVLEISTIVSIV